MRGESVWRVGVCVRVYIYIERERLWSGDPMEACLSIMDWHWVHFHDNLMIAGMWLRPFKARWLEKFFVQSSILKPSATWQQSSNSHGEITSSFTPQVPYSHKLFNSSSYKARVIGQGKNPHIPRALYHVLHNQASSQMGPTNSTSPWESRDVVRLRGGLMGFTRLTRMRVIKHHKFSTTTTTNGCDPTRCNFTKLKWLTFSWNNLHFGRGIIISTWSFVDPKVIVASFYHRIYTDYKAGRQNDFFFLNSHHFL